MKVVLFYIICCFAVVYSWTSIERVPDSPDVCVSSKANVGTMKRGETKTITGECVRASCSPGTISYAGCGSISGPKECVIGPEDLSKPYPECCPQIVCPTN